MVNCYSERRRNFFCKNFNVLTRIDDDILQRRFVKVSRKSLLRDNELAAGKNFDIGKIFHALPHELNPIGEGKLALVLLHDEEIKLGDSRRRIFDEILMTESEGVAVHDERADLNFLRAQSFLVSLKLLVDEIFHAARFELRGNSIAMINGGGNGYVNSTSRKKLFSVRNLKYFSAKSL